MGKTALRSTKSLVYPLLVICACSVVLTTAHAGSREQAKRIHDRLVGTPPTEQCLNQMTTAIDTDGDAGALVAALDAIDDDAGGDQCTDPSFYNVTLKNMVAPWTNEEQTVFTPFNDYTATVVGVVRDELDFRTILYDDILYVGAGGLGLPAYSVSDNDHYETMENNGVDLRENLLRTSQSVVTGLAGSATAGVMTTRAAAKAFFIDGTNRAMFRFTFLNHMCTDLDQIKDIAASPDRIRQDVSRSPGGDSRIFLNTCVGCHAGMDPMAQAFAYYNYAYDSGADPEAQSGQLVYTDGQVQPKYHINSENFKPGYITPNDHWDNYWRAGLNTELGWDNALPGSGVGAKSLGQELANSNAFARCQVEKVFKAVCLRPAADEADEAVIGDMIGEFQSNYNLKQIFARSAVHCRGE